MWLQVNCDWSDSAPCCRLRVNEIIQILILFGFFWLFKDWILFFWGDADEFLLQIKVKVLSCVVTAPSSGESLSSSVFEAFTPDQILYGSETKEFNKIRFNGRRQKKLYLLQRQKTFTVSGKFCFYYKNVLLCELWQSVCKRGRKRKGQTEEKKLKLKRSCLFLWGFYLFNLWTEGNFPFSLFTKKLFFPTQKLWRTKVSVKFLRTNNGNNK